MSALLRSDAAPQACRHVLQIYERTDQLAEAVAEFLQEPLRRREPVIVIATAEHRRAFADAVTRRGGDVTARPGAAEFIELDAEAVLPQLLRGRRPDAECFEQVIASVVVAAANRSPTRRVTAYGELVDLLWRRGELESALRLEELWSDLMNRVPFTLMCGYAMPLLSGQLDESALIRTCQAHSHTLLAYDRARLERALARSLETVLGATAAAALLPLMHATQHPTALGTVERIVVWLQRNLPGSRHAILAEARRVYESAC